MKRKRVTTSRTGLAALLAKLDGDYKGLSRAQARLACKYMEVLETTLITKGYASACLIIRRNARRKAGK